MPKRFFVKSYGCQMNVYDSARMGDLLRSSGHVETSDPAKADVVILNTCHIRERATEKIFSELGRVREMKSERAARGPQDANRGRRLRRPGGGGRDHRPPARRRHRSRPASLSSSAGAPRSEMPSSPAIDLDLAAADKFAQLPLPGARIFARAACPPSSRCRRAATNSAPSVSCPTRGARKSHARLPPSSRRSRLSRQAGVKEITLIGQNVNAYHGEGPDGRSWSLGRLLARARSCKASSGCAIRRAILSTWMTS